MKAAVLTTYGTPEFGDFEDPVAAPGQVLVHVKAATVNAVDIAIASGGHYLSPKTLPVVSGIEGAGVTDEGRRVYFSVPVAPFGSMAERTVVPEVMVKDIPDTVDFGVAATLGNAGLAALMPLSVAAPLNAGENVVVLGGTGVVGRLAVQCARLLGAGSVTVVGRDVDALEATRDLGATAIISSTDMSPGDLTAALSREAGGVDVIVDYLWGDPALAALHAANPGVRLVHVGARAGEDLSIPAQLLRSRGVKISGFMPIHYGPAAMAAAYARLLEWVQDGSLKVECESLPLDDVENVWTAAASARRKLVLVP